MNTEEYNKFNQRKIDKVWKNMGAESTLCFEDIKINSNNPSGYFF